MQTDDKTPAVPTDELWSMAIDRARDQMLLDAYRANVEGAKKLMRDAFDKCPLSEAGARDALFAQAYSKLGEVGGLV